MNNIHLGMTRKCILYFNLSNEMKQLRLSSRSQCLYLQMPNHELHCHSRQALICSLQIMFLHLIMIELYRGAAKMF